MNIRDDRRCPGCSQLIKNSNEGGHDGKPLSGTVYCLRCADNLHPVSFRLRRLLQAEFANIAAGLTALRVALQELSLEPGVPSKSTYLKFIAQGLKRACNRLCFDISRNGTGGDWDTRAPEWRLWETAIHGQKFSLGGWVPLPFPFQRVVNQSHALFLTLVELVLEPRSLARREKLRSFAADLNHRVNQLAHRLNRTPTPTRFE